MPIDPIDCFSREEILSLINNPTKKIKSYIGRNSFTYYIAISDIDKEVTLEFNDVIEAKSVVSSMPFKHFGLIIEFDQEINLDVFNAELQLHPHLKFILTKFGACAIKNIRLANPANTEFHKNIFPDLVFHVDRGPHFSNQYSLFYRDPADPEHALPRKTTTLIMPNAAAELQGTREGIWSQSASISSRLFNEHSPRPAIDHYVFEQKWNAPKGTGEICFFDNRTVLHASYHRGDYGYPIAVQYLF